MKLLFENWKAYITEQLLIERRLDKAIETASNFKKRLPRNVLKSIPEEHIVELKKQLALSIKYMSSRDPSETNKYLMWSARYLVSQLGEYLQVSHYDSEKMHYTRVPRYDKLEAATRDADPAEQRAQILENAVKLIQQRAEKLADRPILFDKGVEMEMAKGGIDQWKPEDADNIESFELLVNAIERKVKEAEMMKRYEKTAKETSDIVADEEDYMMVRPYAKEGSCYYGRGTRWCISATQAQNYFDQYTGQGKAFYFVNFHHLSKLGIEKTDIANFKKLALVYGHDSAGYGEPEEVFDMSDEQIDAGGLRDAVMHNLVAKALKSMSDYEDYVKKFGGEPSTKPFVDVLNYTEEEEEDGPGKLRMLAQALGVVGTPIGDESEEEMRESIEEMISEQVNEIEGAASYHFEQNPAGPSMEKFDELLEAADLQYVNVSVEDYEQVYWTAGARINISDLELIEDDDIDEKVQSVLEDTLSNNHIYSDEIEVQDAAAGEVYVSFNPDYDEQQGLDQFETFLERMSGYDEAWPDMMDAFASDLMDAGLTAGALVDIKASLENTELKNFDFEMEGGELHIETTIQTKVIKPEGIANNPKMVKYMLEALTYKTSDVFNKMENTFFAKVESMIRTALNYYYGQEVLDFGDEDDQEEIFPSWNLGLQPVFADLHREKGKFSGPHMASHYGGGTLKKYDPTDPKEKVLQLPYRFYITMNNEKGWEDMDLHDPQATHPIIKFLKFIDQEDMQFKLEEALTNAILEGLKVHMAQVEKTAEFDKEMAKSKPPVKLDTGDDEDQDVTQGGSFTAPLGPGQVAENCGRPDKKKGNKMIDFKKEIDEEVSEFEKSALESKDHLSPEIWENDIIKPEVRASLLKIAKDFFESLDIDAEIKDIIMTGSLANYNWSEYSDVDLHILIDFSDVDENFELVKGFFNAKKSVWNRVHEILIKGYEVEIYVQDIGELHTSTGIYSLTKNQWMVKPKQQFTDINWDDISLKVESFINQIDDLEEFLEEQRYEETYMSALRLQDRLKKLRQSGLESGGEFSVENLAFKVLRRTGRIADIIDAKNVAYDKSLSVDGERQHTDRPTALGFGKPAY